jgi:hypothetical protein
MWTHLVDGHTHERANKGGKPAIRAFLRRPHAERWFAAIADSGQKHIIPWCPVNAAGQSGGRVLFEELVVDLPRDDEGWDLLDAMADTLTAGATKEEIGSGNYGPRAWQLIGAALRETEAWFGALRGGAWFELALWLAQRDEVKVATRMEAEKDARRRKGKVAKPDSGGAARDPSRVSANAGVLAAEALGSAARPDASGGKKQRKPRGVAHDDVANVAAVGAPSEQLSLLERPR